jgi:hypothetical protein
MRLRQVALAVRALEPAVRDLRRVLALGEPFRDPGVGVFGLENAVLPLGDAFLEVLSPVKPDTTAGRWLDRRGGDAGYMAIFRPTTWRRRASGWSGSTCAWSGRPR